MHFSRRKCTRVSQTQKHRAKCSSSFFVFGGDSSLNPKLSPEQLGESSFYLGNEREKGLKKEEDQGTKKTAAFFVRDARIGFVPYIWEDKPSFFTIFTASIWGYSFTTKIHVHYPSFRPTSVLGRWTSAGLDFSLGKNRSHKKFRPLTLFSVVSPWTKNLWWKLNEAITFSFLSLGCDLCVKMLVRTPRTSKKWNCPTGNRNEGGLTAVSLMTDWEQFECKNMSVLDYNS